MKNNTPQEEIISALQYKVEEEGLNYAMLDYSDWKELKDEKGRFLIKASRFETIKTKMKKYKAIYEQNSLSEDFCNWFYSNLLGSKNTKNII